jgi:hypothetical protein
MAARPPTLLYHSSLVPPELTSAYGYANSKTQYPDGFMSAAQKYNLLLYL